MLVLLINDGYVRHNIRTENLIVYKEPVFIVDTPLMLFKILEPFRICTFDGIAVGYAAVNRRLQSLLFLVGSFIGEGRYTEPETSKYYKKYYNGND